MAATVWESAVAAFSPLLDVLADVPDPRRAEGKLYNLPHVLLFAILAIVAGCNSYRGVERRRSPDIVTFVDVHRRRLNAVFGLTWKRAPAHTAIRNILQKLDPAEVEVAMCRHASCCRGRVLHRGREALRWMARRCAAVLTVDQCGSETQG
jgi:hypothetical protein